METKTEPKAEEQKNEAKIIETEAVQIQKSAATANFFGNKDIFEHAQRVAMMLSQSDLVPKQFQGKQNIGNCIIALEMATRVGASPLMVMQNLYIVHGKPAWSSAFLIATVNACGKFSPLRYEEDEKDGGRTRAWAEDKHNGEKLYGVWVSMTMAKAEGWIDKAGSKWKTMPELMRRYRAAAFFTRQFAPEISMGIHTQEEIHDVPYTEVKAENHEQQYEQLDELFELKKEVLTEDERANIDRIIRHKETASYTKAINILNGK